MALEPCPECGSPVSSYAHACPHCGYPVAMRTNVPKRVGVFLAVAFSIAGAVLAVIATFVGLEASR